jgi:hypothetical protein
VEIGRGTCDILWHSISKWFQTRFSRGKLKLIWRYSTYWRHVRSMYLSKNIGQKHGPFWRWRSTKTTHFVTPGREDLALIASWLDHENCLGGIRLTMAYTSLHHPTPKYVGCCPYMFIYPGIFWLSMTFHSGSSRIQGWFLSLKDGEPFRAPRDKLYHLGWRNFQLDIADIAVTFWWQKDTGLWTKQISLGIWWYM